MKAGKISDSSSNHRPVQHSHWYRKSQINQRQRRKTGQVLGGLASPAKVYTNILEFYNSHISVSFFNLSQLHWWGKKMEFAHGSIRVINSSQSNRRCIYFPSNNIFSLCIKEQAIKYNEIIPFCRLKIRKKNNGLVTRGNFNFWMCFFSASVISCHSTVMKCFRL